MPRRIVALALVALALAVPAGAQSFGRNKVHYGDFDFQVLETPHFDIYYYSAEHDASVEAGRLAERWYARLSRVLDHTFTERQPIVLYASHAQFTQTNIVPGLIGDGVGGRDGTREGARGAALCGRSRRDRPRARSRIGARVSARHPAKERPFDVDAAPVVRGRDGRVSLGRSHRPPHGDVVARCGPAESIASDRSAQRSPVVSVSIRTGLVGISGRTIRRRCRGEVVEVQSIGRGNRTPCRSHRHRCRHVVGSMAGIDPTARRQAIAGVRRDAEDVDRRRQGRRRPAQRWSGLESRRQVRRVSVPARSVFARCGGRRRRDGDHSTQDRPDRRRSALREPAVHRVGWCLGFERPSICAGGAFPWPAGAHHLGHRYGNRRTGSADPRHRSNFQSDVVARWPADRVFRAPERLQRSLRARPRDSFSARHHHGLSLPICSPHGRRTGGPSPSRPIVFPHRSRR